MSRLVSLATAAALGLAALWGTAPARAADILFEQQQLYSGACAENWALSKIASRFRHQVTHVPYLPNVSIAVFDRLEERAYIPASEDHPIARTYCAGLVQLSDGDVRDIWYLIEWGAGFASIGSNVEFCVAGFDRWNVYNNNCRVLREYYF